MAPIDMAYPVLFRKMANKITLSYLLAGGSWILFSDRILSVLAADENVLTTLQTLKGWLFVIVTDLLLYVLLLRDLGNIEREMVLRGESEARAQTILMTVPVSIVEVDLSVLKHELDLLTKQGRDLEQLTANPAILDRLLPAVTLKSMNRKTLDLLGAGSEPELLNNINRVFLPESMNVFRDALLAIGAKKGRFEMEVPLINLNGQPRWVLLSMTIPLEESGFTNVPLSFTDITDRRRAEENLQLFKLTLQQIEDGITITTAQLELPGPEIIYVNAAFTRITGYSAEEAIGLTPRFLQGPKTERVVLDRLRQALWQRQVFHGETVNYRKDGSEFLMEWYVVPLVNEQFQVTHFVAVQREVPGNKR